MKSLAILEMLALQQISIQIGEGYNNFWVTKHEAAGEPVSGNQ